MSNRPIGIFDSGVGGLTVLNQVRRLLPQEDIIYFGDTARVPYGNKSQATVTRFSKEIVKFLLRFRVKLVIVACNTASSLSLKTLRRTFSVPLIGVIKPGVEEAIGMSRTGRIGVIGTEATIASNAYKKYIATVGTRYKIIQKSCPLFVPLAENGWFRDAITVMIAKKYLEPLLRKRVDALILGCTHYPLLKGVIQEITGKKVALIDSSVAAAKHARQLLEKKQLIRKKGRGSVRFFTSDDTQGFMKLAQIFLKRDITATKIVI